MEEDCLGIIPNPITHRQVYTLTQRMSYLKNKMQAEQEGWSFIDTAFDTNIPDNLWICDLCNASLDVGDSDKQNPVKLLSTSFAYEEDKQAMSEGERLGGTALCDSCINSIKTRNPSAMTKTLICGCCRKPELTINKEMII